MIMASTGLVLSVCDPWKRRHTTLPHAFLSRYPWRDLTRGTRLFAGKLRRMHLFAFAPSPAHSSFFFPFPRLIARFPFFLVAVVTFAHVTQHILIILCAWLYAVLLMCGARTLPESRWGPFSHRNVGLHGGRAGRGVDTWTPSFFCVSHKISNPITPPPSPTPCGILLVTHFELKSMPLLRLMHWT